MISQIDLRVMIHLLEIEIDALTESVVEVSTGKIHKTHVSKANTEFLNTIHKKNGWKFKKTMFIFIW
jgi:hypothetical protein